MTIEDLIAHLERIKQSSGNIEVYLLSTDTLETNPVTELQVCQAGVGITIVEAWGPMEDLDQDEPMRVVLS